MYKPISYLIALLFLLIGCNNEIEKELYVSEVPILIAPKQIETSSTKATLESFNQDIMDIGVIEVYKENRILTPYGISPSGINSDYLAFTNPPLVYPVDGSNVTLYGFYPRSCGTVSEGKFGFTLTGQEDLMWAAAVDAGNKTTHSPVSMLFNHKLAKIAFRLIKNLSTSETLPTEAIHIVAAGAISGTLDLTSGTIQIDSERSCNLILKTGLTFSNTDLDVKEEFLLLPNSDYSLSLLIGDIQYPIIFNGNSSTQSWTENTSYLITITITALTDPEIRSKSCSANSSITANITIQDK